MSVFKFDSSNDNYTFLDGFESPELTLKNITLKDAIFKAFEELDAIPRLKYVDGELVLDIDYVNKLRDLIDDSTIPPIEWSRQQDNYQYATEMESDLLNATNISDDAEAVEVFPANGAYISLRSSDFYFNFLNSYFELPKRINYINNFYLKTPRLIVSNDDTTPTEYYNANNKFFYYDDINAFPSTGEEDLYYVAIDGTAGGTSNEEVYLWNGVDAYVDTSEVANDTFPKVRFIDTFANFSTIDTTGRALDIWIDVSTGKSYGYDTSYYELNYIDKYGDLIVDARDRVLEKKAYDFNEVDSGISGEDRYDPNNFYQSNTVYYNYRENKIFTGNTTGLFDTTATLSILFRIKVFENLYEDGIIDSSETYDSIVSTNFTETDGEILGQIWYTPIPVSTRASIDRQDLSDVDRYSTVMDNQGSRIIELANVMDNMSGKINRIGNTEMELDYRAIKKSDLYGNGDYTSDGYVITQSEFIYYKDYIYAKHSLSKNYNMLSKFLGVQSEVRQYDMGEQNTLERKLMYSEYVEVDVNSSDSAPKGYNTTKMIQDDGKNAFLSIFDVGANYQPVAGAMFKTHWEDDSTLYDSGWLLTNFSSNGSGNTLIFDMQLPSNKSAGETLKEETGLWLLDRKGRNFASYTRKDGKLEELQIKLFNSLNYPISNMYNAVSIGDNFPNTDDTLIDTEYIANDDSGKFEILKDNREEIGMTYSIKTYATDYGKVVFGKKLFRRNPLVTFNQPTTIKLYTYDSIVFDKTTTRKAPSGELSSVMATLDVDYTNNTLEVENTLISSVKSYCLTDENDNILIAVNQGDETLNKFTFNFRNKRSDINYFY